MGKIKKIATFISLITSVPFLICVFILLPCMLIIIAIIGGGQDDENSEKYDIWNDVKLEVIENEELSNDISTWLLSYTYKTLKGEEELENRDKIKDFIIDEMCRFNWREDVEDPRVDRFLTLQEILNLVKRNSWWDDDYEAFRQAVKMHYRFEYEEFGLYPYPMESPNFSSPYGYRTDPFDDSNRTWHNGLDMYSSNPYAPLMSISDGEVVKVNLSTSQLGNYVVIKYTDNKETFFALYAHMSGILVDVGDEVNQAEIIGFQGGKRYVDPNAGKTTGRHLHFEIRMDANTSSSSVDPALYIK